MFKITKVQKVPHLHKPANRTLGVLFITAQYSFRLPPIGATKTVGLASCAWSTGFLPVVHGELALEAIVAQGCLSISLAACCLLFVACGFAVCVLLRVVCGLQLGTKQQIVWAYHLCRKPAKYQHKVGNILCNFKTPIYTRPKMDPRHATLREMGLRTEKSIALHLLQENTYESNLVSDIANAPYLRGNAGRTHLAPIPGFPPFVDDIYVYGRLLERDTVRVGNRVSCTTGEHGSAARIVSQISLFVRDVWPPGEHKHIHVSIANTVAVGSGTRIPQTIQGIEERDEGRLASTWAALHGGERAAAYFVAKLDVSELPIAALHAGLPALQRLLSLWRTA